MSTRVDVKPALLLWACERARVDVASLKGTFPKLHDWVDGDAKPTLKQLETFAKTTHTPIGYFFLPEPPVERVPIPDMRTKGNAWVSHPSPDLLDTLYLCQQRQEWYRDFARTAFEPKREFVGSARVSDDVEPTATKIRHALRLDLDERRQLSTWVDALRRFIEQADELGVLVMVNGVVGNNTHRKLDPEEFRGFALADELAPLVFINGADSKSAQIFTLAHELAHLWLGETALSDVGPVTASNERIEQWCNQVAAELLVPRAAFRREYDGDAELSFEISRLSRIFKVSTLVVLRRMADVGGLTHDQLWNAYRVELKRLESVKKSGGGNFYLTQAARVSKRFARAMMVSTWEGRCSFTEAFRLLGVKRMESFRGLSESLGTVA